MTYEEYQGKQEQWINRPYHHNNGQCYLPVNKDLISLPQWVKGYSTGEMMLGENCVFKRMERGWWIPPRRRKNEELGYWYFTDDPTHTPIDIEQWPGPCLLSRSI